MMKARNKLCGGLRVYLAALLLTLPGKAEEFADLSLEELMNVTIYTASRSEEKLFDTASASYVITAEDIENMGAIHVADALRPVPGVNVANVDSGQWAVSVRGFNTVFANKLLVMVDGRTVYLPTFAGTIWSQQDLMLENIDQVEVVRGPGGSLWGANAVNGVINILSRPARETQGGLITGRIGTDHYRGAIRYGGEVAEQDLHYRLHLQYHDHDAWKNTRGPEYDDWDSLSAGLRMDWDFDDSRDLSLQFGYGEQDQGQRFTITDATSATGTSLIQGTQEAKDYFVNGQWNMEDEAGRSIQLQTSYTHVDIAVPQIVRLEEDRFELNYSHNVPLWERHRLSWGLGYRFTSDQFDAINASVFNMLPSERERHLYSGFLQDRISLLDDRLHLTGGIKVEHFTYVETEVQPSLKALYNLDENINVWASVAHAKRTPARVDRDLNSNLISGLSLVSSDAVESEEVTAWEMGLHGSNFTNFNWNIAIFYNDYDKLINSTFNATNFTVQFQNLASAESLGAEADLSWQPRDDTMIKASASVLRVDLDDPAGFSSGTAEELSPRWQANLLASHEPIEDWLISGAVRYVDSFGIDNTTGIGNHVDPVVQIDSRLSWQATENLRLDLTGRNLLDDHHVEFIDQVQRPATEVPRSVYLQSTYTF